MLGRGSYADVVLDSISVKKYRFNEFYIARDAIREASILNHLNDCGVTEVPRLFSVINNNYNTSAMMEYRGKSLMNHLITMTDPIDRCNFIERHLDRIITAIDNIHQAGVVHNDITISNILISEDDEVSIIDFGNSTFGDVSNIDVNITNITSGTSYELPIEHPIFESPESYRYNRNLYSTDYWMLAAWIINCCCDNSEYIPIYADNQDWHRIIGILERGYTIKDLQNISVTIRSGIVIPDAITPSLANRLRSMLEYHYLDRKLTNSDGSQVPIIHQSLAPPLSTQRLGLDESNHTYATSLITATISIMKLHFSSYRPHHVGIAIDIIRRIYNHIDLNHNGELLPLVISVIVNNKTREMFETLVNISDSTKNEINRLEVTILELLRWRVYTRTNVQLSNVRIGTISAIHTIYRKILSDKNVHKLTIMSDYELREYLTTV